MDGRIAAATSASESEDEGEAEDGSSSEDSPALCALNISTPFA